MDISQETSKNIEELQILEHQLQGFLVQKQNIQVELNEVNNALEETKKTEDDVYKILSNVMMKANKKDLIKELEERKRLLELRINSFEKQEDFIESKVSKLREEIEKDMRKERTKE